MTRGAELARHPCNLTRKKLCETMLVKLHKQMFAIYISIHFLIVTKNMDSVKVSLNGVERNEHQAH